MYPKNNIFLAFLFLLLACTGKKEMLFQEEKEQKAIKPIALFVDKEELTLDGTSHLLSYKNSVSLKFEPKHYVYVFQCKEGKVSALSSYSLKPPGDSIYISLRDFTQDVDWYLFVSEAEEEDPNSILFQIPNIQKPSSYRIRPARWRIYALDRKDSSTWNPPQLKSEIQIFHVPFSMEIAVKDPVSGEFQSFADKTQSIQDATAFRLRLDTHLKTYLAVFLCYIQKDRPKNIVQIFPPEEMHIEEIQANATLNIPSQGEIVMDTSENRGVIYCFPLASAVPCKELHDWLLTKARGADAIAILENDEVKEVIPLDQAQRALHVEANFPHLRIDLQPEKKQ